MKREVRTTADGSKTLFVQALDEHYHSYHGALQEARHVFLKMGLEHIQANPVRILEIGFGTGLNALLTALHPLTDDVPIIYYGVEGFPVSRDEWTAMEYPSLLEDPRAEDIFKRIHEGDWEKEIEITSQFTLLKRESDFRELDPEPDSYDLIYFDAFAPDAQPELWTVDIFKAMYKGLCENGYLVTYSAKGQVRRNMIAAGFEVEKVPGPPGKREMLRAKKKS